MSAVAHRQNTSTQGSWAHPPLAIKTNGKASSSELSSTLFLPYSLVQGSIGACRKLVTQSPLYLPCSF